MICFLCVGFYALFYVSTEKNADIDVLATLNKMVHLKSFCTKNKVVLTCQQSKYSWNLLKQKFAKLIFPSDTQVFPRTRKFL